MMTVRGCRSVIIDCEVIRNIKNDDSKIRDTPS